MERKKVSIIIPVYNVEKYLDNCLKSVVEQTYKNLEIIVINDGSTDSCSIICDSWRAKDSRIDVYHYENSGLSIARNRGLLKAKGEYVLFLDSDDYLTMSAIDEMVNAIEKENADMVFFNWENVLDDGTAPQSIQHDVKLGISFPENQLVDSIKAFEYLFSRRIENYAQMHMVRREKYCDINFSFPKHKLFEDVATTYLLIGNCEKIYFLNRKLYKYLQRENSILRTYNTNFFFDWLEAVDGMLLYIKKHYPSIEDSAGKYVYITWLNLYFYSYKFKVVGSLNDICYIRKIIKNKLDDNRFKVSLSDFPRRKDKIKYLLYLANVIRFIK